MNHEKLGDSFVVFSALLYVSLLAWRDGHHSAVISTWLIGTALNAAQATWRTR